MCDVCERGKEGEREGEGEREREGVCVCMCVVPTIWMSQEKYVLTQTTFNHDLMSEM